MSKPENLDHATVNGAKFMDMQLAAASQLRWYPENISVTGDEISMAGWALSLWDQQDRFRFMVNGVDFAEVAWPLPSPDLLAYFPDLPNADMSRFYCRHKRSAGSPWPFFNHNFSRFNVTSQFGEHALTYKTAWYLANPALEPGMPSPAQISRVVGVSDFDAYRRSGATLSCRLDALLRHRFDKPLSSFNAVLDWGCGAGRLTRYLSMMSTRVTGVDIDPDNVAMCAEHIPQASFLPIDSAPPMPFADRSFDLVIGISVFTHLGEANQHRWLAELRRVVRPGGLLLVTIAGQAQSHLYKDWGDNPSNAHRNGIHTIGQNLQLRDVLPDSDYYLDVLHSADYVLASWQTYFDVLDVIPALGCGQNVVVLRARES